MAESNELLSVVLALRADVTQLKAQFGQAEQTAKKTASAMSSAFRGAAQAVGVFGAAFLVFRKAQSLMQGAIAAAQRQEMAQRKLQSAIGFTSTALLQQATALQQSTTFGDEAVIEAQALVGAFIKEEAQIKRLMPVILDFAAAKGMDLRSAADLVTKSIASGTNAMARYGIKITDSKNRSERLESTIKGLETAFGGMATAIAQTPSGILEQQKNLLSDMAETVGQELIPWQIEFNKQLLETLQGWGWIYDKIKALVNPLDAARERDIAWHTQMRDEAFARANNYQAMIAQVKALGTAGQKYVTLELDGKRQVYETEAAILELEKRRRIALRTAGGEAKMTGALIAPTGAGTGKKSVPATDEDALKKATEERLKRQVAEVNAVLVAYNAELSIALAQLEMQYNNHEVTMVQYFETKRALLDEELHAEEVAARKLIGLETDSAKISEMSAAWDKKKADLQIRRIELDREEADAIKVLHAQELENVQAVQAIQARVAELEIQTYQEKLDAELAALAQKHAEELRMLKKRQASVAQIKASEQAQAQERVLVEQQAQLSYLNNSLATVNDVVGQISSIYDQYYQKVVAEERQKMEAQIASAKAAGASESQLESLRKSLSAQANSRAKKAWEKQKRADLASAIIGTAVAVVNALQTKPFMPLGLLMAVLAGAAGAIQIATIAGQSYPGMAEGGVVRRGTTATADDVPARLSRGEYVTPAKSVDYYGTGVMEAMRRREVPREIFSGIGSSAVRSPSSLRFAEGGAVPSSGVSSTTGGTPPIVNLIDASVFDRYLASIEGQRAVVNIISKRSYEVSNALGVRT